jgi:hypothetical protein
MKNKELVKLLSKFDEDLEVASDRLDTSNNQIVEIVADCF